MLSVPHHGTADQSPSGHDRVAEASSVGKGSASSHKAQHVGSSSRSVAGGNGTPSSTVCGGAAPADSATDFRDHSWDELDEHEIADRLARLDTERAILAARLLHGDASSRYISNARRASLPTAAGARRSYAFVRANSDPFAAQRYHVQKSTTGRDQGGLGSAVTVETLSSLSAPQRPSLADLLCAERGSEESKLDGVTEALVDLRLDLLRVTAAANRADAASIRSLSSVKSRKTSWAGPDGRKGLFEPLSDLKLMVDHFISRSVAFEEGNATAFVKRELPLLYAGMDIISWLSRTPPRAKRSRKDVRRIVKTILEVLTTVTYVRAVEGDAIDVWQLDDMPDLLVCFRQIYAFVKTYSGSSWPRRLLLARKYAKQICETSSDMERLWSMLAAKLTVKPIPAMLEDISRLPEPAMHVLDRREFQLIWARYPRWGTRGPSLRDFRRALVELCHDDEAAMAAIYDSHFLAELAGVNNSTDGQNCVSVETVNSRFPMAANDLSVGDIILFHRYRPAFRQNQWMLKCLLAASKLAVETPSALLRRWGGLITDALGITCKGRLTKRFSILYRLASVTGVDWVKAFGCGVGRGAGGRETTPKNTEISNGSSSVAHDGEDSLAWQRVHVRLTDMANSTVCSRLYVKEITWQIAALIAIPDGDASDPASAGKPDSFLQLKTRKLDWRTVNSTKKLLLAMASLADKLHKSDTEDTNELPSPAESNIYNVAPKVGADQGSFQVELTTPPHNINDVGTEAITPQDSEAMRDQVVLLQLFSTLGSQQIRTSWRARYFACLALTVLLLPENLLEFSSQPVPDVVTFPDPLPFDFSRPSPLAIDRTVADWCVDTGVLSALASVVEGVDTPLPLLAGAIDLIYLFSCAPCDPVATWRVLRRGEDESAGAPLVGFLESVGTRVGALGRYDSRALWRFPQVCAALHAVARVCSDGDQQQRRFRQRKKGPGFRRGGSLGAIAQLPFTPEAENCTPFGDPPSSTSRNTSESAYSVSQNSSVAVTADAVSVPATSVLRGHARRISVISSLDGRMSSVIYEPVHAPFDTHSLFLASQDTPADVPNQGVQRLGSASLPLMTVRDTSSNNFADARNDEQDEPSGIAMSFDTACELSSSSGTANLSRDARLSSDPDCPEAFCPSHAENYSTAALDGTTKAFGDLSSDMLEALPRSIGGYFDEESGRGITGGKASSHNKDLVTPQPVESFVSDKDNHLGSDYTMVDTSEEKIHGLPREVSSQVIDIQTPSSANFAGSRSGIDLSLKKQAYTSLAELPPEEVDRLRVSNDPADAPVQFELAERCASQSLPSGPEFSDAVRLYERAARAGHHSARNSLAVCYELGWGVARDVAKAIALYREGAEEGDKAAQRYLGDCYKNGKGVKRDMSMAMDWYARAGDAGSAFQYAT